MVLTLIEDSMTIIGRRDTDREIRITPGGLISSRNGAELYSVAAVDDGHQVSFPTSRYYYLGEHNIIYENHGYALSIPPRYQFLKVVQDAGKQVLHFCDRNGKLLTVEDFNSLDAKDMRDPSSVLSALERASVPTVSNIERLTADDSALGNVEYVAQDLKSLVKLNGNQPSFALGSLGGNTSAVHMFPLKPFEALPTMIPEASVGMLNSEYALLVLDRGSGSATFSYFSPSLQHPAHVQIEPAKHRQEAINAVKSALLEHPLYLIIEGRAFSVSESTEGAMVVRNAQQAMSLLQQVKLIPDDEREDELEFDVLGGKHALKITVGNALPYPEGVQHKFEVLPGVLSNVAVSVPGAEIPIAAHTHGGHSLLFRDFTFEHIVTGETGSSVLGFKKDLTQHAFEALVRNNFALHIPATDSGEFPHINFNGKPVADGIHPLQALAHSAEYTAGGENVPESVVGPKNSAPKDVPQVPQPDTMEPAGDDPSAYLQDGWESSVKGAIVPGEILFDVQAGMRKHQAVLRLHSGDDHVLPTCSYRFGQDEQLIARDIWGHKVVIPEEYRYLKVVLHNIGGQPLYKLSFCDESGKVPDAWDIARHYRDSNSLPDDLRALLDRGIVPDIIANPQFVANDLQQMSLKDLYDEQGHGPAIALAKRQGIRSVLGSKFADSEHVIVGKLASSLAYFDFAAHPYYTNLFFYDDNKVEIPPTNSKAVPDAAAAASRNMLLVLGHEGLAYMSNQDPRVGGVQLAHSSDEYEHFLTQAALALNGQPTGLSRPIALRFKVDSAITDSHNTLGALYPVYALVGDREYPFMLNGDHVHFSRNMLELVYIPKEASPALLCVDGALGKEVIQKVLYEPILLKEGEADHDPRLRTFMVVHGDKVIVRNAVDALLKALPQGVEATTHREVDPVGGAHSPAESDDLQSQHTAGNDTNKPVGPSGSGEPSTDGPIAPYGESSHGTGSTGGIGQVPEILSLPLTLGARIEDGDGRVEKFQVVLRVREGATGEQNPALPTSGYISKYGKIIHVNRPLGYTLVLAPEHQFLKVVEVFENGATQYKLALCDATGLQLTHQDFINQSATSLTDRDPSVSLSHVSGNYANFLRDSRAIYNTGRVIAAGANGDEVAVDLEDVYRTQGYLPYFRLEASESGRAIVSYNTRDGNTQDRPMFLNGEYALFEFDPALRACTLSLSNEYTAFNGADGNPDVTFHDTKLTFTSADQQYSSGMARARIKALERKPLYATVDGASLKFTTVPMAQVVEDPEIARQFIQRIIDPDYHDNQRYSVRIVAMDKYEMGLQGMGVKVGSQVIEIPISREDSGRIGFFIDTPLEIVRTTNRGKKSTQSVPNLQHDVLSEFLAQQVSLTIDPSGREYITTPSSILAPGSRKNAQGGAFLSSLMAHNASETVGDSVGEFVERARKARHAGAGEEPGTDDLLPPIQHTPGAHASDTDGVYPHSAPIAPVVDTLRLHFDLDRNAQHAPTSLGVAAHHDGGSRVAPKVSYYFTQQGELIAYMGPSLFKVLDAKYAKVVQLQDDEYVLRLCDAEGRDLDEAYSDVDKPAVILNNLDWEWDEIYESTEDKPAFTLHMGNAGPSGHVPVVLVPTPDNYLSEDYNNMPVAHLNTGLMVFIIGRDQVTLLNHSVVDSKRPSVLVWDLQDEASTTHNALLQRASDTHPLYLVIREAEVAWTLDKDATDLEFLYNPRIVEWLRNTWLGDSTQVTLRLTIENSEEDSDFLRVRALVLGDTPKVLEQPEGEGLYFDKTTYSIRVRERGTAHEVRTDTPVDIWRVQMLAAVVPEVFSLEARGNAGADVAYYVVSNADEREVSYVAQDLSPENWHAGRPSLLQAIQEHDALLSQPEHPQAGEREPDAAPVDGESDSGNSATGARGMPVFDAEHWGPSAQRLIFVEGSAAQDHKGNYTLWINAEYENMMRFHTNVNARYRTGEYTYEEAIELYNSITTETCRHQGYTFPVIGGSVDPHGQVTVGGYSFGGIEALHKMFELT
ncbi:MAG: hypothetical protein AB8U69_03370 [Anaplasma ovis]